jgi:type II secretory pathway predicted ATPase ExeA
MYEDHYQLDYRPFAAAADARRYVPVGSVEQARQTLVQLIDRLGGAGLVVGSAGVGKTLLCQRLAAEYRKSFEVALLASGRIRTCRALLQSICFEIGLPYRAMDEGELRLSIFDHLQSGESAGMLLFVDEAHTLPSRLLEEIRMLSNHLRDGATRVQVLLVGSSALEERLASPKLESFSQRLGARCYLDSLSRDETFQYVRSQVTSAGGDCNAIFADNAIGSVYHATDGIPRLINQVCDHALMLAYLATRKQLGSADIEEAWADLQQLPAPVRPTAASTGVASESSVVEFGSLDDEPAESPSAGQVEDLHSTESSTSTEVELEFKVSQSDFANPFDEEFAEEAEVVEGVDLQMRESVASTHTPQPESIEQDDLAEIPQEVASSDSSISEKVEATTPEPAIQFPAKGEIDVVYPDATVEAEEAANDVPESIGSTEPEEVTEDPEVTERILAAIAAEFSHPIDEATFDAAERLLQAELSPHLADTEEDHSQPDVIPLNAPVFSYPSQEEVQQAEENKNAESLQPPAEEVASADMEADAAAQLVQEIEAMQADANPLLNPADDPVLPEARDEMVSVPEHQRTPVGQPERGDSAPVTESGAGHVPAPHRQRSSPLTAQGKPDKNAHLADDRDLLVLEDEIGPKLPAKPVTPKPTRRRAYGSLFASLRKG